MLTINNTLDGYLKDVEIKGNTIQDAENLADIRSVGDKVEGQELYEIPVLSCGKNLFDGATSATDRRLSTNNGYIYEQLGYSVTEYIKIKELTNYVITTGERFYYSFYDKGKKYINGGGSSYGVNSPQNAHYIRFDFNTTNINKIQLEEGTVATPYEPYQEDKLTILSPVQLEKVGDVADRIIEKDGVWGVEKNVVDFSKLPKNWSTKTNDSGLLTFECSISEPYGDVNGNKLQIICSKLVGKDYNTIYNNPSIEGIGVKYYTNKFFVRVNISSTKLISQDVNGITKYLDDAILKTIYNTPQFIPLPHDQQIKLRTFANKTNISFLTEIEGTIKAQVPKSLGATVNTHTEQISNLNKELDRVKKLEESTVSTVETESDFTTVEATSSGYFEDVKLEGKTLVNLNKKEINAMVNSVNNTIENNDVTRSYVADVEIGKTYTIIKDVATDRFHIGFASQYTSGTPTTSIVSIDNKLTVAKVVATDVVLVAYVDNTSTSRKVIILEGDHTQNPPSYFEGLKSVGQSASEDEADEIVVSSVNENLLDLTREFDILPSDTSKATYTFSNNSLTIKSSDWVSYYGHIIPVKKGKLYYSFELSYSAIIRLIDANGNTLLDVLNDNSDIVKTKSGFIDINFDGYVKVLYLYRTADGKEGTISNAHISQSVNEYTTHQSDKKRLLYYNNETQTWEKPILRQWDSIEKHADGKYYYHQRSGEVVLNGSEDWTISSNIDSIKSNQRFYTTLSIAKPVASNTALGYIISDLFISGYTYSEMYDKDVEGIAVAHTGQIGVSVAKSKLSSLDAQGLKTWLSANNVTVVYQLKEEKVYECTNIDLITYANETNYIVDCGAIVPRSTLKVHNNISNVVSLLQKKVSLLEDTVTDYMVTQNRLMLASRYNADTVSFKVDVASYNNSFEYDNDLYELILNNILVGKDNYNRDYIENLIIFYWMDFVISDEMYLTLFEIIEEQHNPKVIEAPIEE